jgi:putative transcriptional regulator
MFAENKLSPRAGRLLIAEPFLDDGFFRRAVVLLTEHGEKGSVGFILNRPLEVNLHDAIPDFPEFEGLALLGGPVQRDQLYYIHTKGDRIPDSIPVGNGLWWLGDFETVKKLIAEKEIGVNEIRFYVGYAGWEPGQLAKEMEDKSWYVSNPDLDLIFSPDPQQLWQNAVRKMGRDFAHMANFPQDPSLN